MLLADLASDPPEALEAESQLSQQHVVQMASTWRMLLLLACYLFFCYTLTVVWTMSSMYIMSIQTTIPKPLDVCRMTSTWHASLLHSNPGTTCILAEHARTRQQASTCLCWHTLAHTRLSGREYGKYAWIAINYHQTPWVIMVKGVSTLSASAWASQAPKHS